MSGDKLVSMGRRQQRRVAYALGSPQFIGGYLGAVTIAGAIGAHIAARVPITHAWRPTALSLPKPLARQQTIEVAGENLRTQGV